MLNAIALALGYLLGSVASAIVVCRALGLPDPRAQGSRNPGATNVLRIGGKKAAALTLAGDVLKGILAVLIARLLGASEFGQVGAGFAAFLGHLYPLYFGFQGGKGVATAFGVLLALAPWAGLAAAATWGVVALVFRVSSLAALVAALAAPLYIVLFGGSQAIVIAVVAMVALLIWRHRANIQRILSGSESKLGGKRES